MYHCVRDRGEHAVNRRLSRKRGILQRSDSGYLLEVPDCSDETGRLQEAQTLCAGRCRRPNRVSRWLVVGVLFLGLKDNAASLACELDGGLLTGLHTT